MQDYHQLEVWVRSRRLVKTVYSISDQLPGREVYGLQAQMRRAGIAIPANIAEGCGRLSRKELARFLWISRGSAVELECLLTLSTDLSYLTQETCGPLLLEVSEIQKMLYSLIQSLTDS